MSGVEIAGLVLGAFPLMISALEHYEDTRRFTSTWWRIRRAHHKGLGRLKVCELKYALHMKELLLPLLMGGVITETQYQDLLTDSQGTGWQGTEIREALHERLSDARDRYLAVLQDLDRSIMRLAKATFVDDVVFQGKLHTSSSALRNDSTNMPTSGLIESANTHITFQIKRVTYTLTSKRREALIDEIEMHNATLSQVLQTCDRIAAHAEIKGPSNTIVVRTRFKAVASFWQHADHIYRLMNEAWKCECRRLHCAYLWVQQSSTALPLHLDVLLRATEDRDLSPWEQSLRVRLQDDNRDLGEAKAVRLAESDAEKYLTRSDGRKMNIAFSMKSGLTRVASTAEAVGLASRPKAEPMPPLLPDAKDRGLCALAHETKAGTAAMAILKNGTTEHTYELHRMPETEPLRGGQSFNLTNLLLSNSSPSLLRVEGLVLAYSVACSFLQFFHTSWLPSQCTTKDIHLPMSPDASRVLYRKAYFTCSFGSEPAPTPFSDVASAELGTILLELCFGGPLESQGSWAQFSGLLVKPPGRGKKFRY